MILVELREDGGDLPLAKGIVEGVVDVGRKNPESRGGVAVDGELSKETLIQLVARDVAKLRE